MWFEVLQRPLLLDKRQQPCQWWSAVMQAWSGKRKMYLWYGPVSIVAADTLRLGIITNLLMIYCLLPSDARYRNSDSKTPGIACMHTAPPSPLPPLSPIDRHVPSHKAFVGMLCCQLRKCCCVSSSAKTLVTVMMRCNATSLVGHTAGGAASTASQIHI